MLNVLEEDPDEQNRWRRLGTGALVAATVTGAMVYVANTYAPARELVTRVVTMTFQAPPPVQEDRPLPPLPPPPPPPKPQPKKQDAKPEKKTETPKPDANPSPADPTHVGMDSQSFAEGGSGPGFRVGGNQMGDPNLAGALAPKPPAVVPRPLSRPTKYLMAKPVGRGASVGSLYNKRARKLGLAGLLLIELNLDQHGRVRSAKIRKGIESQFDREVLSSVRAWTFEPPGKVAVGEEVANVRLLRLRFDLDVD